ncbi:MAG: EscU/YscU/HrcU family type III secretion system export apparatus switch protein [Acidimicrobiales bacterium]
MAKPADTRSEKATPKKRRDARRRGEAARSTELPQSVTLVAAIAILTPVLAAMWDQLQADTIGLIQTSDRLDPSLIAADGARAMSNAAMTLVPMLVLIILVSVAAQVGLAGLPNLHKLKPKFDSLKPQNGLKKIFSRQQLWELGRTVLKLSLLGVVALLVGDRLTSFISLGPAPLAAIFDEWQTVLEGLAVGVALLGLLIGFADTVISKRNFERQLKMSKQEIKDEMKQSEGDPLIRSQIRQAQARLSRTRMLAAVADATVVVTNPTHLSVALRYDETDDAPIVVAKGADELAMRMRTEARRHGVPIRENKPIARSLFATANVGDEIPVALYRAVAQLLASILSAGSSTIGAQR